MYTLPTLSNARNDEVVTPRFKSFLKREFVHTDRCTSVKVTGYLDPVSL
jgi:hypothetical protein